VARWNKLGHPNPPSWQIADDDEFERFLKRFYVDRFWSNLEDDTPDFL
jgi:hypothetical protein